MRHIVQYKIDKRYLTDVKSPELMKKSFADDALTKLGLEIGKYIPMNETPNNDGDILCQLDILAIQTEKFKQFEKDLLQLIESNIVANRDFYKRRAIKNLLLNLQS